MQNLIDFTGRPFWVLEKYRSNFRGIHIQHQSNIHVIFYRWLCFDDSENHEITAGGGLFMTTTPPPIPSQRESIIFEHGTFIYGDDCHSWLVMSTWHGHTGGEWHIDISNFTICGLQWSICTLYTISARDRIAYFYVVNPMIHIGINAIFLKIHNLIKYDYS